MLRNRKALMAIFLNSAIISLLILSVYYHVADFPDLVAIVIKAKTPKEGKKAAT